MANIRPKTNKKFVFLSFFLIDFFTAVSVGAMTIAAPRIADYFSLDADYSSLLINAYLVSISLFLFLMIVFSRSVTEKFKEKRFLVWGMAFYCLGVLMCFFSTGVKIFLWGMVVQGLGASALFLGELWIISKTFKDEITVPLAWAETGLASGIVAGPLVGGFFAGFGSDGWRLIFLVVFLATVSATALFLSNYRSRKNLSPAAIYAGGENFGRGFWVVVASVAVVSALSLGMEFVTSVYLQGVILLSPVVVGLILFSNSLGIIMGSQRASRQKSGFLGGMGAGLLSLGFSVLALGFAFHINFIFLAILLLFLMGVSNGYFGVISYAYTSEILPERTIVKGAAIYLLLMQIGNAGGIQLESVWLFLGKNFIIFTSLLALFALVVSWLVFGLRKKYPLAS